MTIANRDCWIRVPTPMLPPYILVKPPRGSMLHRPSFALAPPKLVHALSPTNITHTMSFERKHPKEDASHSYMTPPPSSPPTAAQSPNSNAPPSSNRVQCRQFYTELAHSMHPDFPPQNSFDILMLGTNKLTHLTTAASKRAWLDQRWQRMVRVCGSEEAARRRVDNLLDAMVEPTGRKPRSGDPDVIYIPIPGSNELALRLWPGSPSAAEYCLDFFDGNTKTPINVPAGYKLWMIPDPARPWLQPICMALTSIERAYGIKSKDILPGEEKYILRDGMLCQLCRGNQKVLRFYVPLRQQASGLHGEVDDNPIVTPQSYDI
ncbi:hypothetical protein PYCCODRAFT_772448 [Trametes coccinea BRFM310]|uniref:Uncharacterized protein n=1 Tax=Trametes coccinea (strain BRFM310) TaxID=1353009 RepID=A0A1Y2J0D3_TRAC3|nr:hypothetical protein PYCCODRAFT_772448 [Trametes coccinea BRFM310]